MSSIKSGPSDPRAHHALTPTLPWCVNIAEWEGISEVWEILYFTRLDISYSQTLLLFPAYVLSSPSSHTPPSIRRSLLPLGKSESYHFKTLLKI